MAKTAKLTSQETLNFAVLFDEYLAFMNLTLLQASKYESHKDSSGGITDTKTYQVLLSTEMYT